MSPDKTYRIATVPGDGTGLEVIHTGIKALQQVALALGTFSIRVENFDWSRKTFQRYGRFIPEKELDEIKKYDAIFCGSAGRPYWPNHLSLWSLRLAIVQPLQLYAHTRPIRVTRGISSPLSSLSAPTDDSKQQSLDILIIREHGLGKYESQENAFHPWQNATEVAAFTRNGTNRIVRFAFTEAQKRPRKLLTVVTKTNATLRNDIDFWDDVADNISGEFPDVKMERMFVEGMTSRMVLRPSSLDTILATNMHADILSDLAASLAGGIGIVPSSNLDPTRRNPSMFEPIYGSAVHIVDEEDDNDNDNDKSKHTAKRNPLGAFWTVAEMLRWLGEAEAADMLMLCAETVAMEGEETKTGDLGGEDWMEAVTEAVCREIGDEGARRRRRAEFGGVLRELRR